MIEVRRSTVVAAPVEAVWALLRDFNAHARWHPAIAESRIEDAAPADSVGAVRAFRLSDGGLLREQLIALSDRDRRLTYCLLAAPIPLDGYVATLRAKPVTDGGATFLDWRSTFRAPPDRAEALVRLVGEDIYEAGFAALARWFGAVPAAMPRTADLTRGRTMPAPPASPGALRTPEPASPAREPEAGASGGRTAGEGLIAVVRRAAERLAAPQIGRSVAADAGVIEAEAILVERYGGPEVLRPATVAVPPPGPGEVRIRQTAIGVNFIDVYCRTGYFDLLKPPGVPGMEAAGVVVDVGPGVAHIGPGDRVVYACPPVGAYAAVRTMAAALVVPLAPDVDDETAAAVFLKGLSAEFLLHAVHRVTPDETVLVHAAAGGVGTLLCQWAKAIGATVIGTVSTAAKAEIAAAAGCDHVVLYSEEDFVAAVMRITGGRGADVIYDAVGRDSFAMSLEALAVPGHLVSFGQASGPIGAFDIGGLASKSVTLSRPNYGHYTSDPVRLAAMAERLFEAIRRGIITPAVGTRLPLAAAAEAHTRLEGRGTVGSTVLIP